MDYHKKGKPMVPKPGGPAIILGLVVGEAVLYLFTQQASLLALMATLIIAGVIGLLDDVVTLSGAVKPALLLFASLPILLLGAYDFHLALPFFGAVRLSIIYPILLLLAIPVTSNTVNTIDVLNGVVSGFMLIASIPLIFALLLFGNYVVAAAATVFAATAAAFYLVHRYPSKIFPGDSGSLTLGAGYGALAIIGRAEMVGVVALLPAILNSFFFLSTVKRLVEHRKVKERPIVVSEDGLLTASRKPEAPISLVRLIVARSPMFEHQVAGEILRLAAFSAILAALTALTVRGF
ncbi:MAG: UDP-N-acetylglucosamine-1-phosphate transferase [Thaumarchaeota archaeon]|nr:UDP-N-acetylglucosamine-1-phosphate transferase [Nitrososphaerota archaeon]